MRKISGTKYSDAGVDTDQEEVAKVRLVEHVRATWRKSQGIGAVALDLGYFANVIDAGGIGIAISTDGVGTKALVAQAVDRYDTIGIDCVAMNVNDIVCVGARPLSMVDYVALQRPDPRLLEELAKGLRVGAEMADISISGGEIAQIPDIISGIRSGFGFDLAGTAIGRVDLNKILIGEGIVEGDVVVGIESSGVHSNGLSLAQLVLFKKCGFAPDRYHSDLGCSVGEELLRPTFIYVKESMDLLDKGVPVKAFIHITSDGLLNLTRVVADVGYVIDHLPSPSPVFSLIMEQGHVDEAEMFRVFNMGIGFCVIVPETECERTMSIIESHGKKPHKIGYAVRDVERRVRIESNGLIGKGREFSRMSE